MAQLASEFVFLRLAFPLPVVFLVSKVCIARGLDNGKIERSIISNAVVQLDSDRIIDIGRENLHLI